MTLSDYLDSMPQGVRRQLADKVGIAPTYLYQIEKKLKPVPVRRVIDISRATDWRVTPHDLCPDIYPNPTDGLPTGAELQSLVAGAE